MSAPNNPPNPQRAYNKIAEKLDNIIAIFENPKNNDNPGVREASDAAQKLKEDLKFFLDYYHDIHYEYYENNSTALQTRVIQAVEDAGGPLGWLEDRWAEKMEEPLKIIQKNYNLSEEASRVVQQAANVIIDIFQAFKKAIRLTSDQEKPMPAQATTRSLVSDIKKELTEIKGRIQADEEPTSKGSPRPGGGNDDDGEYF